MPTPVDTRPLQQTPAGDYFCDAKPELLKLFDPRGLRILDAGCAAGGNGELMKAAGAREVVGIEVSPEAAAEARCRLDHVVVDDLANADLGLLAGEPFDVVMAIDVLEHLIDPAETLARLVKTLRPGGLFVASIPNVAHVWVIANLLAGRWPQKDGGIFDRTHLRFFARRGMIELLTDAGLEVTRVQPYFTRYRTLKALSLVLSLYVFRGYFARQYLLVARRRDAVT
jgi:2-polyprenyl-3-methyl-5-hydroxy-6-metoxy-1,4-benzoquinol methylase